MLTQGQTVMWGDPITMSCIWTENQLRLFFVKPQTRDILILNLQPKQQTLTSVFYIIQIETRFYPPLQDDQITDIGNHEAF